MGKKRKSRIKRTVERIDPWIIDLMVSLDSPRSLTVAILWRYKEYDQLVDLKVVPTHYSCPRAYWSAAQATSLLRKCPDLPTSYKRREQAFDAFCAAEKRCTLTNKLLTRLLYDGPWSQETLETLLLLEKARSLAHRILGRAPIIEKGAFGPGVTSQVDKRAVKSEKYVRFWDGTPRLRRRLKGTSILGRCEIGTIKHCDRITTVPKTAKTDRTIGIPIHANGYVQRGLGIEIREKLDKYRKVRLQDTPELHQWLASVAHVMGLSTIDLSAASDTVSFMLVRWLLPDDWFEWLVAARVDFYVLEGKTYEYQKFSAMGNGYTFELETLIFYCLARAVGGSRELTSVFGDDIIIEREFAQPLIELLERVGFSVNVEKSFVSGSFFESCGSDYFDGVAVRPFFLKSVVGLSDLFLLANAIGEMAQWPYGPNWFRDKKFRRPYKKVCDILGKYSQLRVPIGFEAHGLVEPFDKALPVIRNHRNGRQGYKIKALMFRPHRKVNGDESGLFAQLDKLDEQPPEGHFALKRDMDIYKSPRHWWSLRPDKVEESPRKAGAWRVARLSVFGPWDGPLGWV